MKLIELLIIISEILLNVAFQDNIILSDILNQISQKIISYMLQLFCIQSLLACLNYENVSAKMVYPNFNFVCEKKKKFKHISDNPLTFSRYINVENYYLNCSRHEIGGFVDSLPFSVFRDWDDFRCFYGEIKIQISLEFEIEF